MSTVIWFTKKCFKDKILQSHNRFNGSFSMTRTQSQESINSCVFHPLLEYRKSPSQRNNYLYLYTIVRRQNSHKQRKKKEVHERSHNEQTEKVGHPVYCMGLVVVFCFSDGIYGKKHGLFFPAGGYHELSRDSPAGDSHRIYRLMIAFVIPGHLLHVKK